MAMTNWTITNLRTNVKYKKVSKVVAKQLFSAGIPFLMIPCKMSPFTMYHMECPINSARYFHEEDPCKLHENAHPCFECMYNNYAYYNLNDNETGLYAHYYVDVKELKRLAVIKQQWDVVVKLRIKYLESEFVMGEKWTATSTCKLWAKLPQPGKEWSFNTCLEIIGKDWNALPDSEKKLYREVLGDKHVYQSKTGHVKVALTYPEQFTCNVVGCAIDYRHQPHLSRYE